MRRTLALVGLSVGLLLAGCGIPVDDDPIAFVPEEPTAVPATPTPLSSDTQFLPVYLVDANNRVQQAVRELPDPLTITSLVNELTEETTDEERELNLVSIVPSESAFFSDPFSADNIAELDFASGTSLDTLEGEQLTLALAQLVWTLTESPSIEQVIIRIDGNEQVWPTDEGDKSAPLTREDYDKFDPDFVEPTPTTDPQQSSEEEPPSEDPNTTPQPTEPTPEPTAATDGGG